MRRWLGPMVALIGVLAAGAVPAEAQISQYIGGKNKVRYDTFEWKVYETPHFRISYYDRVEPSLEKVASFAESSYDELARRLNFQVLEKIPLLVYATHAEFQQTNVIVAFIPEGVGAFATPVRNRMVMPVDLPDEDLQNLIQHELTHIFQYEIFFQGRRGRAIYARPPLWFMEGMASYYADDEDSRDEMYMRDAALTDRVPSLAFGPSGFLAYRFGHKVFEFVEDEWGEEGVRDFVFSFRYGLGGSVERPVRRTFNLTLEEFDAEFSAWLRAKYAPYADRGMPREFGRPFLVRSAAGSQEASPVVSPSGDLVAAFTTSKADVDVALFGVPDRRLYKNLTKGYTTDYEYLIAQGFTVAPAEGRDLAYSPDGDHVAVFARSERGRDLLLLDAVRGGIGRRYAIELPIDQAAQPAYSPDGRTVAFHAVRGGQFDIFLLDLETGEVSNLTNDVPYDAAPTFSPDGRYLVYTSILGEHGKLVRLDLENPSDRDQLTFGAGNDEGAAYSEDGKRLYFASDRLEGVYDIYSLDLETRRLRRLTNVIGGAINPVPAMTLQGERVGFQAYSRGRWDLYSADPNEAVDAGVSEPLADEVEYEPYVPAVSLAVDLEKGEKVKRRFFLEDARALVGVDQDQNFISQTFLGFSDQYGDRRLNLYLDSIDTFSNFFFQYVDLEPRLQWGAQVRDYRTFYLTGYDPLRDRFTQREQAYRYTAGSVFAQYPFGRYLRAEGSVGYFDRSASLPVTNQDGELSFTRFSEQAPFVTLGLAGDTTLWRSYGPHAGSRWELVGLHAFDDGVSGALTQQIELDGRKYFPITRRSEIATRLYLAWADGNNPSIFAFGGLDTVRGFSTRSISGNRAGFVNIELRFPLVDRLDLSFMRIGQVRARFFVDVGAAWYDIDGQEFNFVGDPGFQFIGEKTLPDGTVVGESGRLNDGVAAYGFGFSLNAFGLPMHWDFIKRWDFKDTLGDTEVDFWIGFRF